MTTVKNSLLPVLFVIYAFFGVPFFTSVSAQGATPTKAPNMSGFSRVYIGVPVCPNKKVPTNNAVLVHLYAATSGSTSNFPTREWTVKGSGKGPMTFGTTSPALWGTPPVQYTNVADHIRMYDSATGTVFQPTGTPPHPGFNYIDHWSLGGWVASSRISSSTSPAPVPNGTYTINFAVPESLCTASGWKFTAGVTYPNPVMYGSPITLRTIFEPQGQIDAVQNPMPAELYVKNAAGAVYLINSNFYLYSGDRTSTVTIPANVPIGNGYWLEIMGKQMLRNISGTLERPAIRTAITFNLVAPSPTPSRTPTPSPTITPTRTPTPTPNGYCSSNANCSNGNVCVNNGCLPPTPTITPTPACDLKKYGDANCNGVVSLSKDNDDYVIWKDEYLKKVSTMKADFNGDKKVSLIDLDIWIRSVIDGFMPNGTGVTITKSPSATLAPSTNPSVTGAQPTVTGTQATKPDLTIETITRDANYYRVRFCNTGASPTATSGKFGIKIFNSSTGQTYSSPAQYPYDVPAAGSCVTSGGITCSLVGGTCTTDAVIIATLDPVNTVDEASETNNEKTQSFTSSAQPSVTPTPTTNIANLPACAANCQTSAAAACQGIDCNYCPPGQMCTQVVKTCKADPSLCRNTAGEAVSCYTYTCVAGSGGGL